MTRIQITTLILLVIVTIIWVLTQRTYKHTNATVYNVVSVKPLNHPIIYGIYYQLPDGDDFLIKSLKPAFPGDRITVKIGKKGANFDIVTPFN